MDGLLVFEPKVSYDERGFFMESYRFDELSRFGLPEFVQDNHSFSKKNVFRGLHFQWWPLQGKLIRVIRGEATFIELDIRKNSPHCGKHVKITLSEENKKILWVPHGFANGFLAMKNAVDIHYKCSSYWNGKGEGSIRYDDKALDINLGIDQPIISDKDKNGLTLSQWLSKEESEFFKI